MRIPGRPRTRRAAALLVTSLVALGAVGLGGVGPAPSAGAAEPVADTIIVTGRGWGHGRGLGQWGAFGYATGRSGGPWSYRSILAHFYGDTDVGGIANPLAAVTLLGQRGLPLVVERAAGVTVAGLLGTSVAARVTLRSDGRFDLERATACTGVAWAEPTIVDGPVRLRAAGTTGTAADALHLCRADGSRSGYRGELVAMGRSFDGNDVGIAQTVNLVRLDDLLRSVVPRQVPPAWGSVDGGRGMQALLAQAVASRGFAAVGDGRWHDLHSGLGAQLTTCDTSACQPYAGVTAEDPVTDDAVRLTTGEVRVRGDTLVRTEYSASSGGWTAGGAFPAVADAGDAVDGNPHHLWVTELARTDIETRFGLGVLEAIQILSRNGFGADGGRVLQMRLVGSQATVELTGTEFRTAFGLRSDWFTLAGAPPRPAVAPRDIDDACPVGTVPAAAYTDVDVESVHRYPIECVTWWQVANGTSTTTFTPAGLVTRGQMAGFLARLIERTGGSLPSDPPDAFTDDDGTTHEAAINALAALGVVRGTAPGTYDPRALVDRAQTATLVARALEQRGVTLPPDPPDAFADDTGSVHEAAINALAAEGIITGTSAGYLEPRRATRRDQMASLLARALDLIVERTGAPVP